MSAAWGPEDTIQVAILEWLRVAVPAKVNWHVPNGGLRSLQTARKLKRLGTRAGVADITVALPAKRVVFIEVKAPGGRLSDEQKLFIAEMEAIDHDVIVARSVADVAEGFARLGIATRERNASEVAA